MRTLVLSSDAKSIGHLTGVLGEYFHQPTAGITMFDDVEPDTLRDITTIVVFDGAGDAHIFLVEKQGEDVDLEADTVLEFPTTAGKP